jgi:diaminohydroxyphosphoribosylaminopyrimidine deaminase / 5-amino-6-(5-phosphoribosylamino)uracil reductase
MSEFHAADYEYMARALRLAERAVFTAHPNPRVGCVLVVDGKVIGEGWHRKTGEAHAEINALAMAGSRANGCTAYVTLEPCNHDGKTSPCTHALIDAGVVEVVAAMADPNPAVAGSGFEALRHAGIGVRVGLMEAAARALNRGFASRFERGRPFVRLKIAAGIDGKTAMATGESQWITGEAARRDVQKLRASSGAVMTGAATVMADNPALTVRDKSIDHDGMQPLRVVLDSRLRMPASSRMLNMPGSTAVFCVDERNRKMLEDAGAQVYVVADADGKIDLAAVMNKLGELQINDVLVEAGRSLAGAIVASSLADELVIYLAPHMMGSETRGMLLTPEWTDLDQRQTLRFVDVRMVGQDLRITARPEEDSNGK